MEHIYDIKPVLREAYRLLSKEGTLYLTLPSERFEQYNWIFQLLSFFKLRTLGERWRKFFNRFWVHHHAYDFEQWQTLLEECGFSIQEAIPYGKKSTCLLNDLFVPFAIPSLLSKKFLNRWMFFPKVRKLYTGFLAKIFNRFVESPEAKLEKMDCGFLF